MTSSTRPNQVGKSFLHSDKDSILSAAKQYGWKHHLSSPFVMAQGGNFESNLLSTNSVFRSRLQPEQDDDDDEYEINDWKRGKMRMIPTKDADWGGGSPNTTATSIQVPRFPNHPSPIQSAAKQIHDAKSLLAFSEVSSREVFGAVVRSISKSRLLDLLYGMLIRKNDQPDMEAMCTFYQLLIPAVYDQGEPKSSSATIPTFSELHNRVIRFLGSIELLEVILSTFYELNLLHAFCSSPHDSYSPYLVPNFYLMLARTPEMAQMILSNKGEDSAILIDSPDLLRYTMDRPGVFNYLFCERILQTPNDDDSLPATEIQDLVFAAVRGLHDGPLDTVLEQMDQRHRLWNTHSIPILSAPIAPHLIGTLGQVAVGNFVIQSLNRNLSRIDHNVTALKRTLSILERHHSSPDAFYQPTPEMWQELMDRLVYNASQETIWDFVKDQVNEILEDRSSWSSNKAAITMPSDEGRYEREYHMDHINLQSIKDAGNNGNIDSISNADHFWFWEIASHFSFQPPSLS